ncbi:MAG TPA: YciI family protein [Hyphomicrobiaceae bacterium]|nr:YciI family protein [Hyphomicrobiaceae bacterium]
MRILGMLRATPESEAGAPPSRELMERMGRFVEEITEAGVMLATDGLHPSAKGKRVRLAGGTFTVIDGPFTESKELIASYALFQVASMEEAVHWTKRFLEVLGKGECELRPIFEPSDFSADVFTPEEAKREEATRRKMKKNAGTP